jgi:hypothetical protein
VTIAGVQPKEEVAVALTESRIAKFLLFHVYHWLVRRGIVVSVRSLGVPGRTPEGEASDIGSTHCPIWSMAIRLGGVAYI